ncbi:hypothetical protein Tco_1000944 [Tanacetum coccineum]
MIAPYLEGNTLGSAEDSMQLKELMVLVPTLVTRINSFGDPIYSVLKRTPKKTLGNGGQMEGKAQMIEEDIQATHKTKEQIRQEEAGLEKAIKLQAQLVCRYLQSRFHLDKNDSSKRNGRRVKEEEQVKRTGKRKKQKARKGINVDKSAQEDSETDKEESIEAMNPTPLTTKLMSVG